MTSLMAYLMVALAAIFWGANFNLSKIVVAEMHPLAAAASRFVIAAVIMLLLAAMRRERTPWRKHIGAYMLLGLVGICGFNLLFFFGMQSTSAVNGALIMALNPLLTSLLAHYALGERLRLQQWLALPVAITGVAIVLFGAGATFHIVPGDALMLGACISWAGYNVLCRNWVPAGVGGLANTAGIMTCGAVVLTVVALVMLIPLHAPLHVPSLYAGEALLGMVLGGTVLSYLFWNVGIARFGAARTALFMNLVPVTSMLIAAVGGAMPTVTQWLGGVLVIGAVLFSNMSFASLQLER
jgi:drug/metabolite transporter (DMT)-like permease